MEDRRHIAVIPVHRSNSASGFTDIVGYAALMGFDIYASTSDFVEMLRGKEETTNITSPSIVSVKQDVEALLT